MSLGEHIALAHVVQSHDDIGLTYCVHTGRAQDGVAASGDQQAQLARLVADAGLKGSPTNLVLSSADYNLFLVDAPAVPTDEMASAVRWKIKDLLDFPAEAAVLDVFELPAEATRNRASGMVYAAVAARSRLEQLIAQVNQSGLELQAIDIPELALRNIGNRFIDDHHGVALLSLQPSGGILNITRQGQLYLTRRINLPVAGDITSSEGWQAVQDRVVLEIQRSLDYFESQMGQQAVSRIVVAPHGGDPTLILAGLTEALSTPVVALDMSHEIDTPDWVDDELKAVCLTVIGAALRTDDGTSGR